MKKDIQEKLYHCIAYELLNMYEIEDDDDIDDADVLKDIIRNFVSDAADVEVESSVADDYWGTDVIRGITIKQNDAVEEEVEGVADNADWQAMDYFSLQVDGDTLLITSDTHSYMNGDYFDAKVTKQYF